MNEATVGGYSPQSTTNRRGFLQKMLGATSVLLLSACSQTTPPSPSVAPATGSSPAPASPGVGSPTPAQAAKAASTSGPASAAGGFPSKPITIIVPFTPGGGFDQVARQIAIPLQAELGQPVVVQNVTGGGGRIAARQFEQTAQDGHTLAYFADVPLYTGTLVDPPEGFDMTKWTWVAIIRQAPSIVVMGKDAPFRTVPEMMAADKAGQRVLFPSNGIGGHLPLHVALASSLGLQNVTHVGGFNGTADMVPSIIRGDTHLMIGSPISSVLKFVQAGDLLSTVALEPTRNALVPETVTARELGLPNIDDLETLGTAVYGMTAAPGLAPERVQVLERAILKALQDPGFLDWARKADVIGDIKPIPSKEATEYKRAEYQRWSKFAEPLRKATAAT